MEKIILKIGGKKVVVSYNLLGVKQVINFLELEERELTPPRKGSRKIEVPMQGVAP